MPVKHSRFSLILLSIIAVAIVILVAGLMVLQRQMVVISNTQKEYDKQQALYEQVQQELATLPDRESELHELDSELASLDRDLIDYKYIPTYLQQLRKTTIKTGNSIRSIRPSEIKALDMGKSPFVMPGEPKNKKGNTTAPRPDYAVTDNSKPKTPPSRYQVQKIVIEVEGSYSSLLQLLNELRSFPKMVYVRGMTINPRQQADRSFLNARIETYAIIIPDQYHAEDDKDTLHPNGGQL